MYFENLCTGTRESTMGLTQPGRSSASSSASYTPVDAAVGLTLKMQGLWWGDQNGFLSARARPFNTKERDPYKIEAEQLWRDLERKWTRASARR